MLRLRPYAGPAIFSYGFRPFFLLGAIYAACATLVWLPVLYGEAALTTAFSPRDWHVHEMLYGFVPAVMTGFLLTAIPNWTGRLPIQGLPLTALTMLWIAGRVAISVSSLIGWLPAALIDVAFLSALVAFIVREIVSGKNWRNLRVAAVVAVFAAGNIAYHIESFLLGGADYSVRLGLSTVVLLLALIGGRIVPSFTHNWLARFNPGLLPAPFGRFDAGTIVMTVVALTIFVVAPHSFAAGLALIIAGALHAARLGRWVGYRTVREPLVLVLHVGYAFVPLGFALLGLAAFDHAPQSAGIHAWTAGAVGVMTLAVMTRASLGHTGQELTASLATRLIYLSVIVAGLARVGAAMLTTFSLPLLDLSALAWSAAFLGFAVTYGPSLCRRRQLVEVHSQ
ncbi:MAG: NnrS family protein [Xanthobacteraceae bacterium]|nr:NnrS family protein [Xanthobacteraceae bacterium]